MKIDIARRLNNPLLNDSLWALVGSISLRGLGLLGSIFIARFLGSEVFGEYGTIKNTIVSIAIFSTFGLGYLSTKYVADYKASAPEYLSYFIKKAFNITLASSILIAVVTFIFSDYVSVVVLKAPQLSMLIKYVAIWIVFNALTTLQIGILSGLGEYKAMAKINTIVGVVTFSLSFLLTYFYLIEGAIGALIISQVVNWYLYYKKINRSKNEKSIKRDGLTYGAILKATLPIASQEAVYSLTTWLSYMIVIRNSPFEEFGLYTASMQWCSVVLFIPGVLRNVILSNLSKEKKAVKHKVIMKRMIIVNLLCTVLPVILILLLSSVIVGFYGDTFIRLREVLSVAMFSTIFISISNVYTQAYMSIGRNWLMFSLRLFRDLGILGCTYFLIKSSYEFKGAMALVWSTLILNIIFMILMGGVYSRINKKDK